MKEKCLNCGKEIEVRDDFKMLNLDNNEVQEGNILQFRGLVVDIKELIRNYGYDLSQVKSMYIDGIRTTRLQSCEVQLEYILEQAEELKLQLENDDMKKYEDNLEDLQRDGGNYYQIRRISCTFI